MLGFVHVGAAKSIDGNIASQCKVQHHMFTCGDALRSTETTECRVRRLRGLAHATDGPEMRPLITTVDMKESSTQNRAGEVEGTSTVVVELHVKCLQTSDTVGINPSGGAIGSGKGMASAGDGHIDISAEGQSNRPIADFGSNCGGTRREGTARLLSAEATSHPFHSHDNLARWSIGCRCTIALSFRRCLGRGVDGKVGGGFRRHHQCSVCLEVKMLLPP